MAVFLLRFVAFRFQESPKYLLYRGHDQKAADVIQKIAKFNHQTSSVSLESFESCGIEEVHVDGPTLGAGDIQRKASMLTKLKLELDRFKVLFSTFAMARVTSLIWLTYICDYWGFTVAG